MRRIIKVLLNDKSTRVMQFGMNIKDNNDRHDDDNQEKNYKSEDDNRNTNDKRTIVI